MAVRISNRRGATTDGGGVRGARLTWNSILPTNLLTPCSPSSGKRARPADQRWVGRGRPPSRPEVCRPVARAQQLTVGQLESLSFMQCVACFADIILSTTTCCMMAATHCEGACSFRASVTRSWRVYEHPGVCWSRHRASCSLRRSDFASWSASWSPHSLLHAFLL